MKKVQKRNILEYLSTQPLMSLATTDGDSLWSATVYFVADEQMNFYFMSGPDTIHTKNIRDNGKVSLTVSDSSQWPEVDKYGIQASGNAIRYKNLKGLIKMLKTWNKKFSSLPAPPIEKVKVGWPFYRIELDKLKVFDEKAQEEEKLYSF